MAQTKRKRQTKHRGNAAGVVESRGRTGRKPTAAEKSGKPGDAARAKQKRLDRLDRPATWRGAFLRALVAAMVLVLLAGLLLKATAGQSVFDPLWGLDDPIAGAWFPQQALDLAQRANPRLLP